MSDEKRDRYIRRMCRISVVIIVLSVVCIIIGILSIVQSAPKFLFPYCLGGSMIAGLFVMSLAVCNLKLYCSYIKSGRQHADEHTVKVWVCRQIVLIAFTMIFLMVGIGVSGIWGMVKATDVINFEKKFNMTSNQSVPYAEANLPFAISSFVLVLILAIIQIVLSCTCICYTDTYGITDNTGYSRRYGYTYRGYDARPNITSPTLNQLDNSRSTYNTHSRGYSTSYSDDANTEELRVNFPRNSDNHRQVPSAPSDIQDGGPSNYRSPQVSDRETGHRTLNDSGSVGQPPSYDNVVEEPPPSYNDVLKDGGFKVSYI